MCLNGRWRGFASTTKRQTSMTDPSRADCARQLLEMTACWSDVNHLTDPGGVDTSDGCFVKNCTSDSCSQWSPRSYCCPETSAKQKTAKKPCSYAKAHSLMEGWTAENLIFQMNRQLTIPSGANIVDDPRGLVWIHG